MARPKRKLTRRERTFGLVGAQVFLVAGIAIMFGTHVFRGLGIFTGIYYALIGGLAAAWGYALGVRVAWATDPQRIEAGREAPHVTARKVPKSK
jgi:hypothetical protein